ncbi:hypothetical protein ACFV0D_00260 [Streptomyces sp. NPDC059556]|uniref:hypothetical protein n=1 Tax=Streptomyces sp. NPDC059556 TaxID=3346863 RepID=UPI0036A984EB
MTFAFIFEARDPDSAPPALVPAAVAPPPALPPAPGPASFFSTGAAVLPATDPARLHDALQSIMSLFLP